MLKMSVVLCFVGCDSSYDRRPLPFTHDSQLHKSCVLEGKQYLASNPLSPRFIDAETHVFYSHTLETCVLLTISEMENHYEITDISGRFFRDLGIGHDGVGGTIFYCSRMGVDNARIDKVRLYKGMVLERSPDLWQDNAEGGPPATVQDPERPYTEEHCRVLFDKKFSNL
jgi:hypothetical protein